MRTPEADQSITTATQQLRSRRWHPRWAAALLAALAMLLFWKIDSYRNHVYSDAPHYQAMADGKTEMKPFAFRVLTPAAARLFADTTGRSTTDGFLAVGLVSLWILLYGVLYPILERNQEWLALAILPLPFWLRNLHDYFLPDPLHAALCMVYLILLRRRWWNWAAALLPLLFLSRESTLLLAVIAAAVLWRLTGRHAALAQLSGAAIGVAASSFAARHAYANLSGINDTLYILGKIPWNLSKNIFGITLWTNTLSFVHPVHVWNLPHWLALGSIHQVGYSAFEGTHLLLNAVQLLTSFGLGLCIALCMLWRTPLRKLLPTDQPWLCIAAIYGAAVFLMAPTLGASLVRLFDYGWPFFLLYLPFALSKLWRTPSAPIAVTLVILHLTTAWTQLADQFIFHFDISTTLVILIACNLIAAWLLLKTPSVIVREPEPPTPSH